MEERTGDSATLLCVVCAVMVRHAHPQEKGRTSSADARAERLHSADCAVILLRDWPHQPDAVLDRIGWVLRGEGERAAQELRKLVAEKMKRRYVEVTG